MTPSPYIKRIILPEQIPPERVADWHAFLATLPPAWWDGKTPEQRGAEAVRMWHASGYTTGNGG